MKEFAHAIAILLGYDDAVSLTRREEERGLATPAFWDDVRIELGRLYGNAGADLDAATVKLSWEKSWAMSPPVGP